MRTLWHGTALRRDFQPGNGLAASGGVGKPAERLLWAVTSFALVARVKGCRAAAGRNEPKADFILDL
jgi:hypothetical protein